MKKKIKTYLVFTSQLYRVLTFVLLPFVALCLYYFMRERIPQVGIIVVMVMIIMAEVILDIWLFGGIQAKGAQLQEYLKTSGRGKGVFRDTICMDLLRRLLTIVGILGICYILEGQAWNSMQVAAIRIYTVLLGYTLSTLGVWLGRFEGNYWTNVVISYVAVALSIASFFLPGLTQFIIFYDLGLVVLAVVISILAVKTVMKKVEGSYYDT